MLMLSERNELLKLNITEKEGQNGRSLYILQLVDNKDKEIGFCNFTNSTDILFNKYPTIWIYKIEVNDVNNRGKAYGKALIDATEYFASTNLSVDRIEGKFYPDRGYYDQVEKFYLRNGYEITDYDDWGHYMILKVLNEKIIDKNTGEKIDKKQEIIQRVGSKIIEPPKVKFVSLEEQKKEEQEKAAKIQKIEIIVSDAEKAQNTKLNKIGFKL